MPSSKVSKLRLSASFISSMATAESATAICAGTCSAVLAPMLPVCAEANSLKQFSPPCRPPMAAVDTARTKIWPNGSL